jgi:AraC family transcriptional regulator
MDPKIVTKGEMILVGLTSDRSDIHGLWMNYEEKAGAIPHKVEGIGYELHRFLKSTIEVTVATEVTEAEAIPKGMTVIHVPAGQYAVFTHRLANGGYEGLNPVMEEWLTTGPYEKADDFIVEVYDERFKGGNQPDSEIDFWIPVKLRA